MSTKPSENTIADQQTQVDSPLPLLPRSAWNSQLAYFRLVLKAKRALDRIEAEAVESRATPRL